MAISGAYFDVALIGTGAALTGGFQSVSGLGTVSYTHLTLPTTSRV